MRFFTKIALCPAFLLICLADFAFGQDLRDEAYQRRLENAMRWARGLSSGSGARSSGGGYYAREQQDDYPPHPEIKQPELAEGVTPIGELFPPKKGKGPGDTQKRLPGNSGQPSESGVEDPFRFFDDSSPEMTEEQKAMRREMTARQRAEAVGQTRTILRWARCYVYDLMENSLGGLLAAISGLGAVVAGAFGAYRASYSFIIVAVGSFCMKTIVAVYFGGIDCSAYF